MKIRNGFVSNSSSSSFVVAKVLVGEDNFYKIKEILSEIEDEFGGDSDSGCYFDSNKEYITAHVSYHCGFEEKLDKLNLPEDSYMFGD